MNKPVIICVDDEPMVLESLKIDLKKAVGDQCLIETAEGGVDALELLAELQDDAYEVAVVLSDYIMPDIRGDELLKKIHTISPNTLKIMLTGQADLEAVGNAIRYAKLYRYIAKPWQPDDLRLTVTEALRSYAQEKQLAERNIALQQINQELEHLNVRLEELVEERTSELKTVNERLQRELNLARRIQQGLLPPPTPAWSDGPDVVCYSAPAREVGGDFYVYHALEGNLLVDGKPVINSYAVAVGDVSGKGMPAALLMAVSLTSLQTVISHSFPARDLLAYLDQALVPYTHTTQQNCALCYVELNDQTLYIANAGCIAPLIKRVNGSVEVVDVGGTPLGIGLGAQFGYQEVSLTLTKGDLVILTSDGVVEATNAAAEMFGFERLESAVSDGPVGNAEAMLNHLKADLAAFVGQTEPHDDVTIAVIQA